MKQSDLVKLFKNLDTLSFSDDLSKQILKAFKPQFESSKILQKHVDEIYKAQKLIENNLSQSFIRSLSNQLKAIQKSELQYYQKNRAALENISLNIKPLKISTINKALEISNTYAKQIMPQIFDFEVITTKLFNSQKSMAERLSNTFSYDLSKIQNMISKIDVSLITKQINYLQNARYQLNFGHNVVLSLAEINKDHTIDYITNEIEDLLTLQISKNKPSYVGPAFFNNLLFFLFTIILTTYIGNNQNRKVSDTILQSEKRIIAKIEKISINKTKQLKKILIVQTKLNVRISPSSKSQILDVLFPNNQVEYIKTHGKWVYVEYFDFIDGLPKTGWLYSKYLK